MSWTIEMLEYLRQAEISDLLHGNLSKDHAKFALDLKNKQSHVSLLATQLKCLQKAQQKLPTWFAAKCVFAPLSYEQCSSEQSVRFRPISGQSCLDLSCGLGVDAWQLAKQFEVVTSLEIDPAIAATAAYNFAQLGANVRVLTGDCVAFLKETNEIWDWIYADPARRNEAGNRVFMPQDCNPNLLLINDLIKKKSKGILIKYSPLYDVDAARKDFPDAEIFVVSVNNECKELLLKIDFQNPEHSGKIHVVALDKYTTNHYRLPSNPVLPTPADIEPKFIYEPDVAFYKTRQIAAFFVEKFNSSDSFLTNEMGFIMSEKKYSVVYNTRKFEVLFIFDYKPKEIKQHLKLQKITRINILQRNFPYSAQIIGNSLGIQAGGVLFLVCTLVAGQKKVYLCQRFHDQD